MEAGAGWRGGADGRKGIRTQSISVRYAETGEGSWGARGRSSGHGRGGWQARRRGAARKPTTTSSRNAAPPTTHETEKSVPTDVSLSPVTRVTHGFHPRAAGTHDGDSPTDASPSQSDTKKCIQVGRETYDVTSQPGTSYTFETRIDTGTFQGQRLQPVTTPVCDDYDSILVIDSSEPRMQPTTTTNTRKKIRTSHGRRANVQTGAWHQKSIP